MESNKAEDGSQRDALHLKKLTLEQVKRIDEVLSSLDDYGEVHLVVQHGEVRYINKLESFKAWKNETNK